MPINANVSGGQQITASVGETQIDVSVSGGVGPTGTAGAAASVTVGTVTTGAPGSSASVVNAGTSSAAVLNFTIPAGATGAVGATGPQGERGEQGIQGIQGIQGPAGATGATGPAGSNATATTDASALVSGTLPDARLSANIARTSDVTAAVAAVIDAAPASLNTLNELAAALGSDANFSTTVTNSLAAKAPIASPTFTGTVSGVTAAMVGLGNVDNTSDASKPVSTAQAAADAAVASAAASDATSKANAAQAAAVQRANHTGTQAISTVSGLQAALDAKASLSGADFTGAVDVNGTLSANTVAVDSVDTLFVRFPTTNHDIAVNSSAVSVRQGTGAFQAIVLANDARLTDARTPVSHTHSASDLTSGTLDPARLPATAVTAASYGSASSVATFTVGADGRLTAAGSTSITIAASAINSGTLDVARLPTATATQSMNGTANVLSTPALVLRQSKIWKLVNLSENQRDITVSGSQGSVSVESLLLTANNGFATANATAIYRAWSFETAQYYTPSGQPAGSGSCNWSWSKPVAFAFRVAIGGFFAATSTARVQFGKKLVTTLGTLDQQGIGLEIRGATLNTNGRLWILAHNGTTLTSTDTGLNVTPQYYDILLTSDGAGTVTALVNDTAYTSTGGPTTDLLNAASGSGIAIEATNGNTANAATRLYVSRHMWMTAQ